jgi:beta-phosphoglucomutase-like phosphatase (HAD superfamily)
MLKLKNYTIKGVIYDLDGTLVSSSLNFQAMRQAVGCPQDLDMLAFIAAIEDPQQRQQAQQLVLDHEHQDAMTSTWLPGAQQLVNQIQLPQAIVTRNNQISAKTAFPAFTSCFLPFVVHALPRTFVEAARKRLDCA